MNELKKHANLLIVLLILVCVKFIIVPIVDWQNNTIDVINRLESKQYKINRLISEQESLQSASTQVNENLANAEKLLFPFTNDSTFKLINQKMLEEIFNKYDLKLENVGWITSSNLTDIYVIRYPIELQFSGRTEDLIRCIVHFESYAKLIEIKEFNVTFRGQNQEKMGAVRGRMTLNLYANVGENQS